MRLRWIEPSVFRKSQVKMEPQSPIRIYVSAVPFIRNSALSSDLSWDPRQPGKDSPKGRWANMDCRH